MNSTRVRTGVLCALLLVIAAGGTAQAASITTGSGPNLLRRSYTLANNEQIVVQTTGCGASGSDSVLFLFEGLGTSRTTRGYSDDAGFSGDQLCSYMNFTNTTGSSKTYEVLGTNYPGSANASITYWVWRSSIGWLPSENLTLAGLGNRISTSGTYRYETVGRRSPFGGYYMDTVLYVIDTTLGSTASRFDDDSAMGPLSTVTATRSCGLFNCWVVAGDFYYGELPINFQVWLNSTSDVDSDGDRIPNSIEALLGTQTGSADPDADGLSDFEELKGVEASSLGGVDASLIMPWQGTGADPIYQDLFVEIDFMAQTSGSDPHTHNPYASGNWSTFVNDLVETFQNDGGFTFRYIIPHVMVSNGLAETPTVTFFNCLSTTTTKFYDVKTNPAFFDPLRAGVFHYVIIGHGLMNQSCSFTGASGHAEIWGNDVIISLGGFTAGGTGTADAQHGTFVHELGHNLSLSHWGNGNPGIPGPNSCVHSSVMNYRYQFESWGDATIPTGRRWGYSNGQCPAVGHGCGNTCNSSACVPSTESSPKNGCSPNNGSCDCDRGEWGVVNVDIPGGTNFTFTDCAPGVQCNGANGQLTREYFLGNPVSHRPEHRSYAAKRRERLGAAGLIAGRDFTAHPQTGRLYSIE